MCICLPPTENVHVEDKEMSPKRRHMEVEIQPQPERAEESQGRITNSAHYIP